MRNKSLLRIGLPSVHSRLHPEVMEFLQLPPYDNPKRLAFYSDEVALFFLRGWDLAKTVEASRIDLTFCTVDTLIELDPKVRVLRHYNEVSHTRIGLCKRKDVDIENKEKLVIVTEYPRLSRKYLQERCQNLELIEVHGATETFALLEGIDAVVDLVDTGRTLEGNGLHLAEVFLENHLCLVVSENSDEKVLNLTVEEISGYVKGALAAG